VLGHPDVPHTWTYLSDIAATLVRLGTDERAWGRPWHVPADPPLSQRDIFTASPRWPALPGPAATAAPGATFMIRADGLAVPYLREFGEIAYQFAEPFEMDSTAFQTVFRARPTP
jgi:hypothetical protein